MREEVGHYACMCFRHHRSFDTRKWDSVKVMHS